MLFANFHVFFIQLDLDFVQSENTERDSILCKMTVMSMVSWMEKIFFRNRIVIKRCRKVVE